MKLILYNASEDDLRIDDAPKEGYEVIGWVEDAGD